MAWNFRKRIKIAPGIHLNLSKGGVSTSIGPKGAKISIGKNGTYLNTSIPGTGLYSRTKLSGSGKSDSLNSLMENATGKPSTSNWLFGLAIIFFIIGSEFFINYQVHFRKKDHDKTREEASDHV